MPPRHVAGFLALAAIIMVGPPAHATMTPYCTPDGVCMMPPPPNRALWVWSSASGKAVVRDAEARQRFFEFCAAPHGEAKARITRVYLETYDQQGWKEFLREAHARGMQVEFIVGHGNFTAGEVPGLKAQIDRVVTAYTPSVPPRERFDGLHFDIEPGQKNQWSQRAYRDLLQHARKRIDEYNAKHDHHLTLAADIGWWWRKSGEDSAAQYLDAMDLCDYVVCMAYRDLAEAQVEAAAAQGQLAEAVKRGRAFWIGCETGKLAAQDKVTYYEEGWQSLEAEIAKLPPLLRTEGLFVPGIAVHCWDSYQTMPKRPRE
ncbi:MAG: glycoside hydrolase family 18 protein [Armatimonadetes bacterium]|nr:glycoside hydrolase family 18 protein [Armatimonadota bacterium]